MSASRKRTKHERPKVRYAVVGLGHIAQTAVLPAFSHAAENSQLTALVSDDETKLEQLGRKYRVKARYRYEQFDELLHAGVADAVYITLPNHLHREYTVRSAEAGLHVLCEKPMAPTEEDCRAMIKACEAHRVALMIAYRLHFDEANLKAVDLVQTGKLGEPRLFNSVFSQQVTPGDIRLEPPARGGGPLYDIGIYCINAARMIFADEPVEAFGTIASGADPRFAETPEMASAVLRFPGDRLASFSCSFGAAQISSYQVAGTEGDLLVSPAYDYDRPLVQRLTLKGRTRERTFERRDQFGPELVAFSECVLAGAEPEPSGREGLADVRVIRALHHSADTGRPVQLGAFEKDHRPTLDQIIRKPPVRPPGLVHTEAPSMG